MSIKKITGILFAAGLLLLPHIASSCSCGGMRRPLKEVIEESNFVAYVKVIRKEALTAADLKRINIHDDNGQMRRLVYQVKEMFKGDSTFFLYEWGINTSCDMGIGEGSEWIFFGGGKQAGISSVSYCAKWIRMRASDGQQDYSYNSGLQTLKELRVLMDLPAKTLKNGKEIHYYISGKIESKSFYKGGQLDKKQVLYYSNGTVRARNHFKEGVQDGQQKEFAETGQLMSETRYANNEWISRTDWYDSSLAQLRWNATINLGRIPDHGESLDGIIQPYMHRIQIRSEYVYDTITKKSTRCVYKWNGLLEEISTHDRNTDTWLTYRYHPNGKISDEIFTRGMSEQAEEKQWDINGKLISHKIWLKGKYQGNQVQDP